MMPSRSTPNLQTQLPRDSTKNQQSPTSAAIATSTSTTVYSSLTAAPSRDDDSPPPAPPVRDSSSLKSIKYGAGHEKFPSWPVPAAAETPQALRGPPGGGSHRSKSWTDQTNYPKEKVVTYTRPFMKRQHQPHIQQKLKTVMEKCEKIPPETFESRYDKLNDRLYLPHVDRDGKPLGDMEYTVPSPPERDITKPQLTQEELEEYARSYQETAIDKFGHYNQEMKGLENFIEYARSYEEFHIKQHDDTVLTHLHQKQLSYAQSEGYHSYVSSTDSTSNSTSTPFLDRLRRDSEAVATRSWDEEQETTTSRREGRDSVVTNSSGSASSSETLKWHGSMSDVSVASSSCTHLANSSNSSVQRQHIAHSARVQTPQRHYSETVQHKSGEQANQDAWKEREIRNNTNNKLKLFAVNTYTVQSDEPKTAHATPTTPPMQSNRLSQPLQLSVADRINELEKQHKYSYLDPNKKHKVPDPTLKAIQKKALLSFYERHHKDSSKTSAWRSEPQLAQSQPALVAAPQPPPRLKAQTPSRRASCASDYSPSKRSSLASRDSKENMKITPRHQHSNSCGSLSTDLLGPVIVGPSISLDDWVPEKPPERPPKNPHLRLAYPDLFQDQRVPSPDLPPPSPPTVLEDEVINSDEPLPPPPAELENWQSDFDDRLKENSTNNQCPAPQVEAKESPSPPKELCMEPAKKPSIGLPERGNPRYSSVRHLPSEHKMSQNENRHSISESWYDQHKKHKSPTKDQLFSFPNHRNYAERSSTRYPSMHKLVLNGNVAVSQKVVNGEYRAEPLRPMRKDCGQRASIAEGPRDAPPPLQPRQMRINQSMRARIPESRPGSVTSSRNSGPRDDKLRDSRPVNYTMSQSKASYLASKRDRDKIIPDPDSGSYKRTTSPNGHIIQNNDDTSKLTSRDSWSGKPGKEAYTNNNNNGILRRSSMCENKNEGKEEVKKIVLPDVLPMTAKIMAPRSQFRPANLSLSPHIENFSSSKSPPKSPPSSPPKSPSRNSPYAPLRSTNLSSSPIRTPSLRLSPQCSSSPISPQYTQPLRIYSATKVNSASPPPAQKAFPELRPTTLSLQRAWSTEAKTQRASLQEIRTLSSNSLQRLSPSSPTSSNHTSISLPARFSPPPLPKSSPPPRQPEIKPTLSPSLSNKTTPIKNSSPISTSTNTPLRTTPESSPPSSPKVLSLPPSTPPESPRDTTPKVIEGLQMIQRTEVVLRVNTTTSDASSQTEKEELPPTPLPTRKKLQEEIDCEKLSQDFVSQLPVADKLKDLLVPGPEHKKITDYVTGLFKVDVTLKPRPPNGPFRSKNSTPRSTPPPVSTANSSTVKPSSPTANVIPSLEPTSPLPATSPYFTTSEPKARFLTRFSQDMNQYTIKNTKDLNRKKDELVNRLDKKLEVLRSEQIEVSDECRINNELGQIVEDHISKVAKPHEISKFRLHIEEVGKIISLLLGLSGRLARVENALMGMTDDNPEKRILEAKRDKLLDQLEEAKKLKESIDKRSVSVSNILYKYLNTEEYADYDHFINMKAKLIMDSKEIDDKIKLGEEQLSALRETLIVTD